MKTVISASRRTDLVRFYYQWLQDKLAAGAVEVANPRFPERRSRVDLRPDSVHSIVLWSKDFANVLRDPGRLADYNLYFQYTVNNYSRRIEPRVPAYAETLRTLDGLLKTYRPEQFNIRFDPVLFTPGGENVAAARPESGRLKAFGQLCRDLADLGLHGCRLTTSYLALYPHVKSRLQRHGIGLLTPDDRQRTAFFGALAETARRYGFALFSCSSPLLETVPGLGRGHCIDGSLLAAIFGGKVSRARDTGQRPACGCTKSVDIGGYDQRCGFGCLYCYATRDGR